MKIKIRKGLFETNSSSVHCICICTCDDYLPGKKIVLRFGENGSVDTFEEKVNYIYNMCGVYDSEHPVLYPDFDKSYIYKLVQFLKNNDFTVVFDKESNCFDGVVDERVLEDLFADDCKLLKRFLFDNKSFVKVIDNNYIDEPLKEEIEDKEFNKHFIRYNIPD